MNRLLPAAMFVGSVLTANLLTARYGLIPVGFGLAVAAGTLTAGLALLIRDWLNQVASWAWVAAAIAVGAALSYALTPGWRLAVASGVAFAVSELADWAVYQPLRRRGWVRAALASNVVGAVVDSWLFLTIAGFPLWPGTAVQVVVKVAVTSLFVGLAAAFRTSRSRRAVA